MSHDELTEPRKRLSPQAWASRLSNVWNVGVVILGSDGQVDFASESARRLLDARTDDEFALRWLALKRQLNSALRKASATRTAPIEIRAASAKGGAPDLCVQIHVVEEEDCVGYLLLLDRAERADAIDRSLRNASRSRSLASLSRDMAHDLKDVLNVIAMNVELLSRAAENGASDAAQVRQVNRCADVVRRELRRMDRALDVLLDGTMVERDSPQPVSLTAICEALMQLVAARAFRQHVEVTSTMPQNSAEIKGFPDRLHGALLSLMINALDAMPDGGGLHLSLTAARTIELRVCDSGPGIDADRLSDIWRLHFTTKTRGTGIGLYVARSIIEAHGGTIQYQPNPKGGSCFIVELPSATSN
jgi:signal transduction histidine kinase